MYLGLVGVGVQIAGFEYLGVCTGGTPFTEIANVHTAWSGIEVLCLTALELLQL